MRPARSWTDRLLAVQAAYFVATGVWPFLHRGSFERVTGRKHEYWLVQAVGALVAGVGVTLAFEVARAGRSPTAARLAALSALALGAVELYHAARRRISPVYALDAVLEAVFIAAAFRALARAEPGPSRR